MVESCLNLKNITFVAVENQKINPSVMVHIQKPALLALKLPRKKSMKTELN